MFYRVDASLALGLQCRRAMPGKLPIKAVEKRTIGEGVAEDALEGGAGRVHLLRWEGRVDKLTRTQGQTGGSRTILSPVFLGALHSESSTSCNFA